MIRDTAIARTVDSTELEWMTRFIPAEPWMATSACQTTDPDAFFPEAENSRLVAQAKKVCEGCPALELCLAYALANDEKHGIWGATTPRDRARMRKAAGA